MRDLASRIKNAEALAKAGIISKQEMERIVNEAEKEFAAASEQPTEQTSAEQTSTSENKDKKDGENKN